MTKNIIDALEQMNRENREILTSKNYQYGLTLLKWQKRFLSFDFIGIKKSLQSKLKEKIIKKNFYNPELRKASLPEEDVNLNNIRVVVYTCITGSYDKLKEPLLKFDNVDYVLFTDNPEVLSDTNNSQWQIRKISNEKTKVFTDVLANRYIKLHPHEFFSEDYDYSVYIDGNMQMISDPRKLAVLSKSKCGIAMHTHRSRRCLYEEAEVCKMFGKGVKQNIEHQIYKYRKEGFPGNFGLMEANVIAVNLSDYMSGKIFSEWWNEFLTSGSLRDQLSFPYVIWKNKKSMEDVNCLGPNAYENDVLRGYEHS